MKTREDAVVRVAPIPLFGSADTVRAGELSLVTVNVQHAAPQRADALVAWLAQPGVADVVVLTEVGHGPGRAALLEALARRSYHTLTYAEPDPPDYSVVIASRGVEPRPISTTVDYLPHRAIAAEFSVGTASMIVAGVYVPSRGPQARRNQDKRAFQVALAKALPRLVEVARSQPLVVAGDLNVVEPGHQPHLKVFGTWEYEFYRSFAAAGLVDAYRRLNPDEVEHSWFGRGGIGYRLDHLFISDRHGTHLESCRYLHECREQGLSDHSALSAKIRLGQ